jgi:iron complex transport system ATP-binding protein
LSEDGLCLDIHSVGYRHRPVIENLSLSGIRHGEILALVGPNGAGKSTLLRGMAGLLKVEGAVRLDGQELQAMSQTDLARVVTYMPQSLPQNVSFTVFESILSALRAGGPQVSGSSQEVQQRAVAVLRRLDILDLALSPLDQLSGGQRQLVSLAQSLVRKPRVLLLDEPTSALDMNYQLRVMGHVRDIAHETAMVVVVVLHDLTLACRWAHRVAVLHRGRLVAAGRPEEAITTQVLRDVYAVEAHVGIDRQGYMSISVEGLTPTSRGLT